MQEYSSAFLLFSCKNIDHTQKQDQPDRENRAVSEINLRQDLNDLILRRVKQPVGFSRKEDVMEYGESAVKISRAEPADDHKRSQDTGPGPK